MYWYKVIEPAMVCEADDASSDPVAPCSTTTLAQGSLVVTTGERDIAGMVVLRGIASRPAFGSYDGRASAGVAIEPNVRFQADPHSQRMGMGKDASSVRELQVIATDGR